MTAAQLGTLAVVLGLAALVSYLIFFVVPSLAEGRMTLELSEARSVLREIEAEEPGMMEHPDVARLDALLATFIRHDRSLGLTYILAVGLRIRRDQKAGLRPAGHHSLRELSASQLVALHWVSLWVMSEVLRASFMASKVWFLVWPFWLYASGRIRRWQARPFAEDTRESDDLADALWQGVTLDRGVYAAA